MSALTNSKATNNVELDLKRKKISFGHVEFIKIGKDRGGEEN